MSPARISWGVMGHPERERGALALSWMLGATLTLDEGWGENGTGDRAWTDAHARAVDPARPVTQLADWCVVLQDDARPVAAIYEQAVAALAAAPTPVVSFYLGTGYPEHTVTPARVAMLKADEDQAAWIVTRRLFWGVAVAIRTELVPDMLKGVGRSRRPYDERISRWAEQAGHRISYTWPSLVDHADGESLVRDRPRRRPRIAYRTGTRTDWATSPVEM